jgi:hypothetical protein
MSEAASTVTEEVVYIGRKPAGNGKLAHWYRTLVDGEISDKEIGSYKPYTAAPVGAIITIIRPADEPTMLYTSGQYAPRITGAYADTAATDEWRVTDQAEAQRDANERRVKRDLDGLPAEFTAALDTLGAHFSRLNSPQRAALLTLVTAKLLRY